MRIVTPIQYKKVKKRRRHLGRWAAMVLLIAALGTLYFRPLPAATISISTPQQFTAAKPNISWPAGQAAFGAAGYDLLETNTSNSAVSTASIAKVITALCILEKKPIMRGEQGPLLTMGADDVARYRAEVARDGTTFAVNEGDQLSEYEALEAILLPSANNIADTAAIWAFGSLESYRSYAQAFVYRNGMSNTTIGPDASGYDPSTTSTPADLIKLAKLSLKNSVLMEIAGKQSAVIGDGVQINNHNLLAGKNGVTGLKTGRNDENSGALLFTATVGKGEQAVNLTGIVINAGTLSRALSGTSELIDSLSDEFPKSIIAKSGAVVGTARTAWGSTADIVAEKDLTIQHWAGSPVYSYHDIGTISGTKKEVVGTLYAKANGKQTAVKISIRHPATSPSILWRLTHLR